MKLNTDQLRKLMDCLESIVDYDQLPAEAEFFFTVPSKEKNQVNAIDVEIKLVQGLKNYPFGTEVDQYRLRHGRHAHHKDIRWVTYDKIHKPKSHLGFFICDKCLASVIATKDNPYPEIKHHSVISQPFMY